MMKNVLCLFFRERVSYLRFESSERTVSIKIRNKDKNMGGVKRGKDGKRGQSAD
jgi:hypothetical protein